MITHKIAQVEDTVCQRCPQCWEQECRAFSMWGSVAEWNHRKNGVRTCQHFEIDPTTKKFIEDNGRVFVIFEGVCPECGESLKMKSIGGIADELENWNVPAGIEPTVWREPYPPSDCGQAILGIEYVCPHQHVHYVERNRSGDWNE